MTDLKTKSCTVIVETDNTVAFNLDRKRYFSLGKIDADIKDDRSPYVVVEMTDPGHKYVECTIENCIPVPPELPPRKALMLPPLICALQLWDIMELELGEAAIYTTGSSFSALVGQVAVWRGGSPVIQLVNKQKDLSTKNTVELFDLDHPENSLEILSSRLKNKPGVAIVELSGKAECIDFIFQVIPKWGRLLLTIHTASPLTIDFYNNIHRKGVVVKSNYFNPDAFLIQNKKCVLDEQVNQASRILDNEEMSTCCERLIYL